MRHFHRTHLVPDDVLAEADAFFPSIGLRPGAPGGPGAAAPPTTGGAQGTAGGSGGSVRSRVFSGDLGSMRLEVKPEGGHYTFVEVVTDQMGESRMDRNVKKFFVRLHKRGDPSHAVDASF